MWLIKATVFQNVKCSQKSITRHLTCLTRTLDFCTPIWFWWLHLTMMITPVNYRLIFDLLLALFLWNFHIFKGDKTDSGVGFVDLVLRRTRGNLNPTVTNWQWDGVHINSPWQKWLALCMLTKRTWDMACSVQVDITKFGRFLGM